MSILSLITEQERTLIEDYIHWYGPSQSDAMDWYHWTNLETVLHEWADQKSKTLIKLMDNQLILRRPYVYAAQTEGLSREIKNHLNDAPYVAFEKWWQTMTHTAGNTIEILNPDNTSKELRWFSVWHFPTTCFNEYTLACNEYQDEDVIIVFPSGKKMKMFKGMKPMKIFHRFIEEFHGPEDIYDAFRTWHSMQLNQKKMDGELCLSIHPLDYMTMSDNANNWESCMRWTNKYGDIDTHGDFRSGTIECLNSPYIIEAYLHNPKHTFKLSRGEWEWNSKQWRELFIVQDGVIHEIKGYPFQDENLTNTCLMWIKELAAKNLGWEYESEEVNVKSSIELKGLEGHANDVMYLNFVPTQHMYNDMGTLTSHRGRINKKVLMSDKYDRSEQKMPRQDYWSYFIDVPYGGVTTCMCCGQTMDYPDNSNIVFCHDCDAIRCCACCGEIIYDDSSYYIEDIDDYYCENCWSDNCCTDSLTEETHLYENMTEIELLLGYDSCQNPIFDQNYRMWVYEPRDNWEYERIFNGPPKTIYTGTYTNYRHYYVTVDMVNEHMMNSFYAGFDIYPRPKCWEDLLNDYPEIIYDTNMQDLYPEDE